MYVKTYQNASTNWILRGEMEILKITQRQHNTHTETVLRDKFVKLNCSAVRISQVARAAFASDTLVFCLSRVLIGKLTSNSKSRLASGGHIRRRASASWGRSIRERVRKTRAWDSSPKGALGRR